MGSATNRGSSLSRGAEANRGLSSIERTGLQTERISMDAGYGSRSDDTLSAMAGKKQTREVFGVSPSVLPDSYVDRGNLDEELRRLLHRPSHIALRGESKCGKSWLRQSVVQDAIVIQCRLGKTCVDIYRDALGALGVRLEIERSETGAFRGRAEADTEVGIGLIAKVRAKFGAELETGHQTTTQPIGQDFTDLEFVAELLRESGRRLVIEDFHYLSIEERKKLAFDLKAMWDFKAFVVIVGVWSKQNMLIYLNPDLTGRVEEVAIVWRSDELGRVFEEGGTALNIRFGDQIIEQAIHDCFENVGILQRLILGTLDDLGIEEVQAEQTVVDQVDALEAAAMAYAEQLNPLYQQFAERVSSGVRRRSDSTGIYAHAMAVILEASDKDLVRGVKLDDIHEKAHGREPRIQKGNLKTVLEKFEGLQVDEDGRGLVLGYNEAMREISAVDRQLLLYRKYSTVRWPWEDLIAEAEAGDDDYQVRENSD